MYQYTFYIQYEIALTGSHANDNKDWTTDPRLTARMFSECRRRYLQIDLQSLTAEGRLVRIRLLRMSAEYVLAAWKHLNQESHQPH
jgi:hypothetical protein